MEWSPAKLSLPTPPAPAGCCSAVVIALVPCIVDGCFKTSIFSREIKFLKNAWLCGKLFLEVYHREGGGVTGASGSCLGLRGTLSFC